MMIDLLDPLFVVRSDADKARQLVGLRKGPGASRKATGDVETVLLGRSL